MELSEYRLAKAELDRALEAFQKVGKKLGLV